MVTILNASSLNWTEGNNGAGGSSAVETNHHHHHHRHVGQSVNSKSSRFNTLLQRRHHNQSQQQQATGLSRGFLALFRKYYQQYSFVTVDSDIPPTITAITDTVPSSSSVISLIKWWFKITLFCYQLTTGWRTKYRRSWSTIQQQIGSQRRRW